MVYRANRNPCHATLLFLRDTHIVSRGDDIRSDVIPSVIKAIAILYRFPFVRSLHLDVGHVGGGVLLVVLVGRLNPVGLGPLRQGSLVRPVQALKEWEYVVTVCCNL